MSIYQNDPAVQIERHAACCGINSELVRYIGENIFPQYAKNDKGHGLEHILYVIKRSLLFMDQFDGTDVDMVYTIAACHDIAHYIDKDNHEALSAQALRNDAGIRRFFSEKQIGVMAEAIEDHRASLEYMPRSVYGMIVSSADRSTDFDDFLLRTHAYSLKHFPEYTIEQMMERCYQHMKSKYGSGGYSKHYVEDSAYLLFLQTIRDMLNDKDAFYKRYKAVISERQKR